MIGQMAIAIALLGFNDLGRSVTPTFLFRNIFYLQLSPHCPKMNKKALWEVKKISRFLSMGNGILPSCCCKAREIMVAKCELVLWGTSPVDWIRLISLRKPYLAENISLQSSNCTILGLVATVPFFANEARFTQIKVFFGACSLQNEIGDPHFFTFLTSVTSFNGKIFRKKSMLENFRERWGRQENQHSCFLYIHGSNVPHKYDQNASLYPSFEESWSRQLERQVHGANDKTWSFPLEEFLVLNAEQQNHFTILITPTLPPYATRYERPYISWTWKSLSTVWFIRL